LLLTQRGNSLAHLVNLIPTFSSKDLTIEGRAMREISFTVDRTSVPS